jgi:hypothetical protein
MSGSSSRVTRHRLTILSSAVALVGAGVVAANFAGAASGPAALDYAQCSNGPVGVTAGDGCVGGWINGILNSNNSQYREDQVTPQRLVVSFPDKGTGDHAHSVTLRYLDRKAGIHAYDSLASVDATQSDAATTDVRCLGYTGAGLTTCQGLSSDAPHTTAVVADDTQMGPVTTGVDKHVSAHQLPNQVLTIFGAKFTPDGGRPHRSRRRIAPWLG